MKYKIWKEININENVSNINSFSEDKKHQYVTPT